MKDVDRFQKLNRPLTDDERASLRSSIEAKGCLNPVVMMQGDVIIDGYNRWEICKELGIKAPVKLMTFASEDAAYEFAIGLQLGRRNVSTSDRDRLLGELYRVRKNGHGGDRKSEKPEEKSSGQSDHLKKTCEQIASEVGVSERTVRRAAEAAEARENLTPAAAELVEEKGASRADLVTLSQKEPNDQERVVDAVRAGAENVHAALSRLESESAGEKELQANFDDAVGHHRAAKAAVDKIKREFQCAANDPGGDYLRSTVGRLVGHLNDVRNWLHANEPTELVDGRFVTRFRKSQDKKND